MPEVRAGLMKIATVEVSGEGNADAIVAAGDVWLAAADIRRIATRTLRDDAAGNPQSVTCLVLSDGTLLLTAAAITGEDGVLEASEAAQVIVAEQADAAGNPTGTTRTVPGQIEAPI